MTYLSLHFGRQGRAAASELVRKELEWVCDVLDWSFSEPFDENRMAMPIGAVYDQSQP